VLHRSVKPPILSCFGDLALAIGPSFEPFLDTTMKNGSLVSCLAPQARVTRGRKLYRISSHQTGLLQDAQPFMEGLLSALQSPVLHRSVKPPILSCFGDLALAEGAANIADKPNRDRAELVLLAYAECVRQERKESRSLRPAVHGGSPVGVAEPGVAPQRQAAHLELFRRPVWPRKPE
jgi:hypothetical protein